VPFESWIDKEKIEKNYWEKETKIEDKKLCMCETKKKKSGSSNCLQVSYCVVWI
jgi:hypothetical protein